MYYTQLALLLQVDLLILLKSLAFQRGARGLVVSTGNICDFPPLPFSNSRKYVPHIGDYNPVITPCQFLTILCPRYSVTPQYPRAAPRVNQTLVQGQPRQALPTF